MDVADGYEMLMGSDAAHGGMYLELWDRPRGKLALWAFYSDAEGSFELERHRSDVPADVEKWFVREAHRRLPPMGAEPGVPADCPRD